MGSRPRKLKTKMGKNKLSSDKTIGGPVRLTEANVNTIQLYCVAINRNTEAMKAAI